MGTQALQNEVADLLKQLTHQHIQLRRLVVQQPKTQATEYLQNAVGNLVGAQNNLACAIGTLQHQEMLTLAYESEGVVFDAPEGTTHVYTNDDGSFNYYKICAATNKLQSWVQGRWVGSIHVEDVPEHISSKLKPVL